MSSESFETADIKQKIKYETLCLSEAAGTSLKSDTPAALGYYLTFSMLGLDEGYAFVLFLDKRKRLLRSLRLKRENKPIQATVLDAVNSVLRTDDRVRYFLLVHNHKNKPLFPSPEDAMTTDIVTDRYHGSKAVFLGHYITSGLDYILLTEKGVENRKYTNFTESPGMTE